MAETEAQAERAFDDWLERYDDKYPKATPGEPRASSLEAFEPSLHFVDFVHALDDNAVGRGGYSVLEGAEADADVDAPHDGSLGDLRVHVVLL